MTLRLVAHCLNQLRHRVPRQCAHVVDVYRNALSSQTFRYNGNTALLLGTVFGNGTVRGIYIFEPKMEGEVGEN
jgi:hypothetical protein